MKIFKPIDRLCAYVRYYWVLESYEPFTNLTFPIGCPQMIFHKRTPLYIPELDKSQSIFTISGQVNFPAHIQSHGDLEMIVAVFYPQTIGMFIDTPPSAFYNQEISGYDIENRQLNDIAQKIFDCDSHRGCIDILERWLLSKIKTSVDIDRVGCSIANLIKAPSTSVNSLANGACLCKKQFERIFRSTIGMNPKEYSRIVRFQKALWMLQRGANNYAWIAADCGYADQSHLIKDFKVLSGFTPQSLMKHCSPYSDLFTNPI